MTQQKTACLDHAVFYLQNHNELLLLLSLKHHKLLL